MITQIEIKNFKSIKEAKIQTKRLNLLMGLNGMGKSSFIQMLLLLMQSDKLEERIIELNGILAQIGRGQDALYQFAKDDFIEFGIGFEENKFSWKFNYQKDKDKLISEVGFTKDQMKYFRAKTKLFQYISAERIGPREIYDASSITVADKKQLGLLGEFAAYYINVFGSEYDVKKALHHPKASSGKLNTQINAWLREISPGISLNTKYVPEVNKVILDYQFDLEKTTTNPFRPKNVGFGISYVLPIILALLTVEENKIVVIENPESHIHPRGQVELGKLISLAAQSGAQIFIETHSDHILNGIRVAVKDYHSTDGVLGISKDNVNIMYFEKNTTDKEQYSKITPIRVDYKGELDEYPKDFLDEWSNQLLKLL
jgi:predicted ATPase